MQALEPAPDLLCEAVGHPVNAWRAVPPHVRVHLQKQGVQLPAKRPFAQLSEATPPAAPAEPERCGGPPGEPELEERGLPRAAEAKSDAPVSAEV